MCAANGRLHCSASCAGIKNELFESYQVLLCLSSSLKSLYCNSSHALRFGSILLADRGRGSGGGNPVVHWRGSWSWCAANDTAKSSCGSVPSSSKIHHLRSLISALQASCANCGILRTVHESQNSNLPFCSSSQLILLASAAAVLKCNGNPNWQGDLPLGGAFASTSVSTRLSDRQGGLPVKTALCSAAPDICPDDLGAQA